MDSIGWKSDKLGECGTFRVSLEDFPLTLKKNYYINMNKIIILILKYHYSFT